MCSVFVNWMNEKKSKWTKKEAEMFMSESLGHKWSHQGKEKNKSKIPNTQAWKMTTYDFQQNVLQQIYRRTKNRLCLSWST